MVVWTLPITDESFYNIVGNEISRTILVQQMIDYYNEKLEIGETRVTDFNEGSEIRNLLESIAVDLYTLMEDQYELSKIAFITTSYGEWLDLHGANPLINLPRDEGQEAIGLVTFSIPEAVTEDIVIPEETVIVDSELGLEFETDTECTIIAGDTSSEVYCTCLTVGTEGNIPANTLTVLDDENVDESVTCTNLEDFTGGTDYEEDDVYRERLLGFIRQDTFGSLGYYENLAESVDGVHDVKLIDDTDNQEPKYTKIVLVNGNVKETPDDIIMQVLVQFTMAENIVLDHKFSVDKPTYTMVNLTVNLDVENLIDNNLIEELLGCYFDGGTTSEGLEYTGLYIDESLTRNGLYSALQDLNFVEGVQCFVTGDTDEITTVSPAANGVLRLGTVLINQNIVGA